MSTPKDVTKTEPEPDYSVAKEIYLHFTNCYNKFNWVHNYPAWEDLNKKTKTFWVELVELAYQKEYLKREHDEQ